MQRWWFNAKTGQISAERRNKAPKQWWFMVKFMIYANHFSISIACRSPFRTWAADLIDEINPSNDQYQDIYKELWEICVRFPSHFTGFKTPEFWCSITSSSIINRIEWTISQLIGHETLPVQFYRCFCTF